MTEALKSQAARDARQAGYGEEAYWLYLDRQAFEHAAFFCRQGDIEQAARMFTQSLAEALEGNDGA